ncbi:MAG TPA: hypothetical protein VMI92_13845 [Steroidobacteraceae bacterium]|nr:hypothetical protein [Steroidobacteraceae bacterium]
MQDSFLRPGLLLLAALGLSQLSRAGADATAITLYSSQQPGAISADFYRPLPGEAVPQASAVPGYALVRQDRDVHLDAGHTTLRYSDVAGLIDPTTVTFTVPSDPQVRVQEQNFQFDLVSNARLLQRYIDRPVTVDVNAGNQRMTLSGTLLSATDGLVLREANGTLHALRDYAAIHFAELPGGLITQPTLVWELESPTAGDKRARVTYQTGGMTWWADYNVIFSDGKTADSGFMDLSAWVSIINQSGAGFTDAKLKLVAGDVHRAPAPAAMRKSNRLEEVAVTAARAGFAEQSFDEFHLYTLGRPATLPNNSTKQLELFDRARQVPARRKLVYNGSDAPIYDQPFTGRDPGTSPNTRVESLLVFRNDAASGLGMPLPAGRVRVSRLDPNDGSLEFVGEDVIGHTPRDETLTLQLGTAFDVVGERKQTDYVLNSREKWLEEQFEIRIRNHKSQAVNVEVREPLYRWSGWKIVDASQKWDKDSARQIHFDVAVPRDGETVLHYRVRYSW